MAAAALRTAARHLAAPAALLAASQSSRCNEHDERLANLKAEVALLRGENARLRRALDGGGLDVDGLRGEVRRARVLLESLHVKGDALDVESIWGDYDKQGAARASRRCVCASRRAGSSWQRARQEPVVLIALLATESAAVLTHAA